ncbi:hypothetical protein [Streptomyces sp. NBC_00091]|uniref:hypothetical protein n=1 Tax=Streptomyces sp. NBC_00091 TaxID=2975648 RepID=UPI00224CC62E|nr:hypothetical protein [Streptomyces sp. NBC_00091]MCX5381043.1 hypothetical protein [Streptomyces sp. NBC_00091]
MNSVAMRKTATALVLLFGLWGAAAGTAEASEAGTGITVAAAGSIAGLSVSQPVLNCLQDDEWHAGCP